MTQTIPINPPKMRWFYLLAIGLYSLYLSAFSLGNDWFRIGNSLELAPLIDLSLVLPLAFALAMRRQPKKAMLGSLGLFAFALFALSWTIPKSEQQWLPTLLYLRWAILLAFVALELRVLWHGWRIFCQREQYPTPDALVSALLPINTALPDISLRFLRCEARMWSYVLWRKPIRAEQFDGDQHFSYHAQQGNASTLWGMLVANALCGLMLHPVLHLLAGALIANIVTGLTMFGSLWLYGEYRASLLRPISLDSQRLYLRYGCWHDEQIALARITSARILSWRDQKLPHARIMEGFGGANVELKTQDETTIYLGIDEPQRFVDAIQKALPDKANSP